MINGVGLDAEQVLRNVEIACRQERAARNKKVVLAAAWADCHPPESISAHQLQIAGGDRPIQPGGDGTPEMAGFAVAEFATELRMSIAGAERFIADGLDLRHRLPQLWARLCRDEIDGHQAQHVARETRHLSAEQAALVDAEISGQVGRQAWAQTLRNLEAKIIEVDAERIAELAAQQQAQAGVWTGDSNEHGMKTIFVRAPAPTVIWFEAMIDRFADLLRRRGDTRSADERRAAAVDVLSNPLHGLRLLAEDTAPTLFDPEPSDVGEALIPADDSVGHDRVSSNDSAQGGPGAEPPARFPRIDLDRTLARAAIDAIGQLDPAKLRPDATLYVHIAAETLRGGLGLTRVEDVGPIVSTLVADWLRDCRVTVRPVIDLTADQTSVDAYEIPRAMRERRFLRRPSSVFPYSSSTGRRLDLDHTISYQDGVLGQTRDDKLGPLGRTEHRIVTHGPWQKRQPEPGIHLFRAPHGRVLLVNPSGTHDLGRDRFVQLIWQTAAPAPSST